MKWNKKGFICSHKTLDLEWYKKNTMVPVPYLIDDTTLRIFLTMCDKDNIGRIGYIDVNPQNPSEIIDYSKKPVLDIGENGAFDDSGVLPSAIYKKDNKLYMFYSAYQKQAKVPYSILSGLAVSYDKGQTFKRVYNTPLLERKDKELFIRSAPFCIKKNNYYLIYYSSGTNWTNNKTKVVPEYDIKLLISKDFFNWGDAEPKKVISLQKDEYGLTTPNVWFEDNKYKMTYSIRSISKGYRIGYAESNDAIEWNKKDDEMQLDVSETGWDSEMICFGNLIDYQDKRYLFYCGNHYGMAGFGYAELIKKLI